MCSRIRGHLDDEIVIAKKGTDTGPLRREIRLRPRLSRLNISTPLRPFFPFTPSPALVDRILCRVKGRDC